MEKIIITVSREFGSGGKELGKLISELLNIPFYDSEIINMLSLKTGLSVDYIYKTSESGINNPINNYARSFSCISSINNNKIDLMINEQKIIKEIANNGSCVIVGRAADTILKEYNPFRIFVYSDMESKVKRCFENASKTEKLKEKEIIKNIKEIDKNRKKYYDIISNNIWADKSNYDLCVNTTNKNLDDIAKAVVSYIKLWEKKEKMRSMIS